MSDSSTLQPELPTGEGLNQDSILDPEANAPSDDLFGEDLPEHTEPSDAAEMKPAPPTGDSSSNPVTSDSLDPPLSSSGAAPVTENSSGITPVAQFLPSDAKLDHPIVSPAEALAAAEATVDKDTLMNDVSSQDLISQDATSESAPVLKKEPEVTAGPDPVDSATSVPTPPAEKTELPNGHMEEPQVAAGGAQAVEDTKDVPSAQAQGTSTPQIVEPADQNMMDTPSSGVVRPRDDAETGDEPAAKRARTEEPGNDATAKFKDSGAPAPKPAPTSSTPAATTNGNSIHTPPASIPQATVPKFSSDPMTPAQKSVLIEKIKNTKKVKSATFFLKPVDPVALNIPHYLEVIKKPMDLGTMEKKLKADRYSSVDDFVSDFQLMIQNCLTFNGAQHMVSVSGQNLRAYFLKQMETVPTGNKAYPVAIPKPKKSSPKPPPRRESRVSAVPGAVRSPTEPTYALLPSGTPMIRRDSSAGRPKRAVIPPQRDLPYNQAKPKRKENQLGLKFCDHILDEFKRPRKMAITSAFLLPVDPVALNIPTYFNVVKKPMDLQTMTNKLKNNQYATAQEFKEDFDLMLNNCFIFNPAGNPVHEQGKALQAAFNQEWAKKDSWIKKNTPQSQRASPASDVESDGDESEEGEEDAEADGNEATIAMLRQQLVSMQQTIASISGAKPPKTKKKKPSSAAPAKPTKKSSVSAASKPAIKAKPKKQRQVTYEEKQEISNATENMNDDQIGKLTTIITENVAKYKDMDAEDVELEIDDLPNDVQHKLLRYVRSLFPPKAVSDDGNAIDDDYEPERPAARATKKKHKPMKKHEQESRIKELQEQMSRLQGGLQGGGLPKAAAPAPAQRHQQSSDEDDSESSEEE